MTPSIATELLVGAGLGLSLAVPPGPMNAWIAAASTRAYRSGVATGFGAMTADVALGLVVFVVYRSVNLRAALPFVYLLGAGVMAFLAYRLVTARPVPSPSRGELRTYSQAFAFGLTNPFQVLWWLTAGVGFAYVGGLALLLGLFGAIAAWVLSFPALIRAGVRRSARLERGVVVGSAVALAAFAGYFVALAFGA